MTIKKTKILSLALASLLLAQATGTSCFFRKKESKSPERALLKAALIFSGVITLLAIIPAIALKLTGSDGLYVGILRQPRNNGPQNPQNQGNPQNLQNPDQRREILLLRDPRDTEHRIKFQEGVNCFNKKVEIKWPEDQKGHKLDNENNQEPDADWKKLRKEKYEEENAQIKKDETKPETDDTKLKKDDTKKTTKIKVEKL